MVTRFHAQHLTHLVKGDDQSTLDRRRATRQTGAGTSRRDRYFVVVRPASERGDFISRPRSRHREGFAQAFVEGFVVQVARVVFARIRDGTVEDRL